MPDSRLSVLKLPNKNPQHFWKHLAYYVPGSSLTAILKREYTLGTRLPSTLCCIAGTILLNIVSLYQCSKLLRIEKKI